MSHQEPICAYLAGGGTPAAGGKDALALRGDDLVLPDGEELALLEPLRGAL